MISKNRVQLLLSGASIVNFMCGPTEFKWLKSNYLFYSNHADKVIHISFPPRERNGKFRVQG